MEGFERIEKKIWCCLFWRLEI